MQTDGSVIRLLLVDDEVGYLEVLYKRLTMRGLRVSVASSGTEAIRLLRKHDFDVAVLDLKMQDMDGIEVLKIFKKMDPNLAVIMLTGHGSEQAARDGKEMGAFDYLTKPCELNMLLTQIQAAAKDRAERVQTENATAKSGPAGPEGAGRPNQVG